MRLTVWMKDHRLFVRNLLLYGLIGALAMGLDFGSFYVLNTRLELNKYTSNIIAMHLGMLLSFFLNTTMNFKKTDKLLRRFLSYYAIVLCGMALSTVILQLGALVTDSTVIVKGFSVLIVSLAQFFFNKFITFRL